MKTFEIDVSGSHPLEKDYTIAVAEKENESCILAYKFSEKNQKIIKSKWGQRAYRYPTSQSGGANIKIRLYCTTIYYIFKELKERYGLNEINLKLCNDFDGNQWAIKKQLVHFLNRGLGIKVEMDGMEFVKLPNNSFAHSYAKKNQER